MENAAKALLIAAGILFAILTMSLLTVMFRNIQTISEADETKKVSKELQEWNAQWEAYNKQIMYGSDVLTVVNKAAQVNIENEGDKNYQVTVKVYDKDGREVTSRKINDYLKESQLLIFECKRIEYNNNTGRVNLMEFKNTGK